MPQSDLTVLRIRPFRGRSAEAPHESGSVARDIYPTAVQQARERFVLDIVGIAAWVGIVVGAAVMSSERHALNLLLCVAALAMEGARRAVADFQWWRWLRQADPEAAFVALQHRD